MAVFTLEDGFEVFRALSSPIRARAFDLICRREGLNIKQIAEFLQIPITTLSPHITALHRCGLIELRDQPLEHGIQKRCYPAHDMEQLIISLSSKQNLSQLYSAEIPVGCYSDFEVTPTCGLATTSSFVGQLDEPRYFAHPRRLHAGVLWFTTGYVEYALPNFIPASSRIEELSVSFEISSEAPRYNADWPSDITFSLNGIVLGSWTSPGDYGDRPGRSCPDWWYPFLNQYGLLKCLSVTPEGSFLDGKKLSGVSTRQLALTDESVLKLRFAVHPDAPHPGGLTLFGSGFGDYGQNIQISIRYLPM